MELVALSPLDLAVSALLLLALAGLSLWQALGMSRPILVNAARAAIQLLLVGLILEWVFSVSSLPLVAGIGLLMLLVAAREVQARQQTRLRGLWGYGLGTAAIFIAAFGTALLTLLVMVRPDPWYHPQYAIPLLGMLLGNTMTGVAVGLDRLHTGLTRESGTVEAKLLLGMPWHQAIVGLRREAVRAGLIPSINAMAAAGIVALPGMMTGQILAGTRPIEAVKYQILILFLITAGTGFGAFAAVLWSSRRCFDARERLRLDRLKGV